VAAIKAAVDAHGVQMQKERLRAQMGRAAGYLRGGP
jgi:hypothetical protein